MNINRAGAILRGAGTALLRAQGSRLPGGAVLTCPSVLPVCHRAFLRCSPVPVVEFTTLRDTPE